MTFTLSELLTIIGAITTFVVGGGGFYAWSNHTIDRRDSINKRMDNLIERLETEVKRMDHELKETVDASAVRDTTLRQEIITAKAEAEQRIAEAKAEAELRIDEARHLAEAREFTLRRDFDAFRHEAQAREKHLQDEINRMRDTIWKQLQRIEELEGQLKGGSQ